MIEYTEKYPVSLQKNFLKLEEIWCLFILAKYQLKVNKIGGHHTILYN